MAKPAGKPKAASHTSARAPALSYLEQPTMRLARKDRQSQHELPPGSIEADGEIFELVMSPMEWKEVHALAEFARVGLDYDCHAPYVIQVFTYDFSQPEGIQSNENMQAAFAAVIRLAETIPADGRNFGKVTLELPKVEMWKLLYILKKAVRAEEDAGRLSIAAGEEFPYQFPALMVSSGHYARAFDDCLTALREGKSLSINLHAAGNAPPKLDAKHLPSEIRAYLEGKMRELVAQNSDEYADDTRTSAIQTDELMDKINSESLVRYKAAVPPSDLQSEEIPQAKIPHDSGELNARVEKQGGTISGPFTAGELRSQLPAEVWSKITNIDPALIEAEEKRQQVASLPRLIRYRLENDLAKTLLEDEQIKPYLRAQPEGG